MADSASAATGTTTAITPARSGKGPSAFLEKVMGRQVLVKLSSGIDYRGVLACLDGYMNLALEGTVELVDGRARQSYGDAFIRGNNVLYISAIED